MFLLTLRFFLVISVWNLIMISHPKEYYNDISLQTEEIIQKYGYPAETHTTETEDGYILTFHRVPHGKNSTTIGFPILAAHGLFEDSSVFFLRGEKSLGFLLADEGYDVWLANMRGNHYCRSHRNLTTHSYKFWDFSWHEFGIFDLPATIDYILHHTQNKDLLFLGYSMGTTAFFVMASERPEYARKIRGAAMLGPVVTLKHSKAPLKIIAPFVSISQGFFKIFTRGEYNNDHPAFRKFTQIMCNTTTLQLHICRNTIFLISGFDIHGFDEGTVMNILDHGQSSTSTKTIVHFTQLAVSGKFRQYDHGHFKNKRLYGQKSPPEYPLRSITTPMSLFVGHNDIFATVKDVSQTLSKLSFVKSIYQIPRKTFTHLDFLLGKDVKEILYNELLNMLKYLINQKNNSNKKINPE